MSTALRDCQARHDDGAWYDGVLLSWTQHDGRWRAVVRYRTGPGAQYQRGLDQDHVRPAP